MRKQTVFSYNQLSGWPLPNDKKIVTQQIDRYGILYNLSPFWIELYIDDVKETFCTSRPWTIMPLTIPVCDYIYAHIDTSKYSFLISDTTLLKSQDCFIILSREIPITQTQSLSVSSVLSPTWQGYKGFRWSDVGEAYATWNRATGVNA